MASSQPLTSPAPTTASSGSFDVFLQHVEAQIVTPIITLLALGAFAVFVWGVVEFIQGAADAEKRSVGQKHILWGLIGLTIIFGAGALVAIIQNTANSLFQ